MATLFTQVKLYLEANSKTWEDEENNIELRDNSNGLGPFVHTWNVSGLAKPSEEQLAAQDSAADTVESNERVRNARRKSYGNIGDQLDEIFKDIDAWKTRIQSIKDANPKE